MTASAETAEKTELDDLLGAGQPAAPGHRHRLFMVQVPVRVRINALSIHTWGILHLNEGVTLHASVKVVGVTRCDSGPQPLLYSWTLRSACAEIQLIRSL